MGRSIAACRPRINISALSASASTGRLIKRSVNFMAFYICTSGSIKTDAPR